MKIKTSELSGEALDYAVANCLGQEIYTDGAGWHRYGELAELWWPSTSWKVGGPLFDEYCTAFHRDQFIVDNNEGTCWATVGLSQCSGNDILEAFLRALVTERSGKEVEVPDELVQSKEGK